MNPNSSYIIMDMDAFNELIQLNLEPAKKYSRVLDVMQVPILNPNYHWCNATGVDVFFQSRQNDLILNRITPKTWCILETFELLTPIHEIASSKDSLKFRVATHFRVF